MASISPKNKEKLVEAHRRTPSGDQKEFKEFRERTRQDSRLALNGELEKLLATIPSSIHRAVMRKNMDGFQKLFMRYLVSDAGPSIKWDGISPPPNDRIITFSDITGKFYDNDQMAAMLDKLAVVKLNGGLGTSMGCQGPKSVISVRSDLTFLDMAVQQIEALNARYEVSVPLVLMNSFNTTEETKNIIRKYSNLGISIHTFEQSKYPRISRETLLPVAKTLDPAKEEIEEWCPPGHGDIYASLYNSGLLDQLLAEGKELIFVSNIDNLGATVDLDILSYILNPVDGVTKEFVMEVTNKTRADVKGGTLIQYNGRLQLLEIAQVPKQHVDDFKSVSKFKIFNTNNLWINLKAVKRLIEKDAIDMEVIVNPKLLDNGLHVIQLETAAGSAIHNFEGSVGINVPRTRFLPVKKTSDLLLVMSNLYSLNSGSLMMNPKRSFPSTPLVKLGNQFDKVKNFLSRFDGIPDILELDHLTVSGDVWFGRGVTLKGTVIIIANHGDRIDIPAGAILENKIVSGNLRILDH